MWTKPLQRNRQHRLGLLLSLMLGTCAYTIPPVFSQNTTQENDAAVAIQDDQPAQALTDSELLEASIEQEQLNQQTLRAQPDAIQKVIDLTLAPDNLWQRIRHGFAIPNLETNLVNERQQWYVSKPRHLQIMLERAGMYLYYITRECEHRGLPTELALIPFIESAFNPYALSPAQATGLWQFVPATGRSYGLKQDGLRDERRDVIASTRAALDYLTTLYEMYGDWYLALAAYNWGEGSVARAIEKNKAAGLPTDYQHLSMPEETRQYVPKLQAVKNIIANPNRFGLQLPIIQNEPFFAKVNKPKEMDIKQAARLADMSVEEFKALNPNYGKPAGNRKGPDDWVSVLVPAHKIDAFQPPQPHSNEPRIPPYVSPKLLAEKKINKNRFGKGTTALPELAQIGGEGLQLPDGNNEVDSGPYRDPYLFARQATQISQSSPLLETSRYAVPEEKPTVPKAFNKQASKTISKSVDAKASKANVKTARANKQR